MKRMTAVLYLALLVGGLCAVAVVAPPAPRPAPAPEPAQPAAPAPGEVEFADLLPPPPYSETPFLNAGSGAGYVGSAACAGCHPREHESYLLTAHSKALAGVNPADEPPDGAFEHRASGRAYRVYRKGGQLRHEEVLRAPDGTELARTDLPVRYRVGSGHFTRTYLVEIDGFLHESPVTWYASKGKWDVSPGFDVPNPPGFERPVRPSCIACHAGHWERAAGRDHSYTLHERAIGCENCHGPGSLHRELRAAGKPAPGGRDLTIVHPGKLSRPLLESICAECHLATAASVLVRGRRDDGFRPGRPLSDFRAYYAAARGAEKMTVVGHVGQLRQSKCYQGAPDLTCVTCHDPHAGARPADPVAFYRRKCLDCHERKPCALPPSERAKRSAADDCASCHMPRSDTDVPHVAFTHHRIGRHAAGGAAAQPPAGAPDLVAVEDGPHLAEPDRRRNLGMAYRDAAAGPALGRHAAEYRPRALGHLAAAHRAGVRDPETLYALADLSAAGGDFAGAVPFAREALRSPALQPESRAQCLHLLSLHERANGNHSGAAALLEQVVRVRQSGADWGQLAACYLNDGRFDLALPAYRRAVALRPAYAAAHLGLAACYRQSGDEARAKEHLRKEHWLRRPLQP
jgi:hypothetical protein